MKTYLDLTDWLWSYILYYAQITAPLQARKMALMKTMSTSKGNVWKQHVHHTSIDHLTSEEVHSFHTLQKLFAESIFLCHFDSEWCLYIDVNAFRLYGFRTVVYHIENDSNSVLVDAKSTEFSQNKIQSILFLSKLLISVKHNYWPTEMKTAKLIWVVWKTWHLIESVSEKTIIFTDHSVTIFIAWQTHLTTMMLTDKLNLCLVCTS